MSNKIKLKRYLIFALTAALIIMLLLLAINIYEYHVYTRNYNQKLSIILNAVHEQYPFVTDTELIEILNGKDANGPSVIDRYGIDIENSSAILENESTYHIILIANLMLLAAGAAALILIFLRYDREMDRDIAEITRTIERINKRNYELDIDSVSEDELSILKSEIYKTAVMLREAADNSDTDKLNLKKSLEDISHQLKTPLTSILIMLDNIIDDPDMDPEVRDEFIRSIKRDTVNINFMVQTILKLSRLDSNTISFIKEKTCLRSIVEDSIQNVSALCDLRDIKIDVSGDDTAEIICDRKWQTEAVTNILKNCIDHSFDDGIVEIRYSRNNVYSMIEIRDCGEGISEKDLPHVFERFYKGENSSPDSIGIGLALSKSIIEEDNGTVSIDSDADGTRFKIRYYTL